MPCMVETFLGPGFSWSLQALWSIQQALLLMPSQVRSPATLSGVPHQGLCTIDKYASYSTVINPQTNPLANDNQ